MKLIALISAFYLSFSVSFAQVEGDAVTKTMPADKKGEEKETTLKEKDVPATVLNAFKKKFPAMKATEWEQDGDEFEAEFKKNGIEYQAVFKKDGTWLETETELKEQQVPAIAIQYIKTNYKDFKMKEFELEETPAGKVYEIEIKKDKEEWDLYFDLQGNFLKKEQ